MRPFIDFLCDPSKVEACAEKLAHALDRGSWVQLRSPGSKSNLIPSSLLPIGPGVVVESGGSSGGRKYCLQPADHLDQSALATAKWLLKNEIEPTNSLVLNPLPLHHVSGLMPWWRSRYWKANHIWLKPSFMRDPFALEQLFQKVLKSFEGTILISLVPTQLQRLLSNPEGVQLLRRCSIIWVGGSNLSDQLAKEAKKQALRLSPCYGSTETAAMVTALSPKDFLSGVHGCGKPLSGVELKLSFEGALQVKTPRLAIARWTNDKLESLVDEEGWWTSGDSAYFFGDDFKKYLAITGRIDCAINSGGETVFPEQLEGRLMSLAAQNGLRLEYVLFLPRQDMEWGQRFVALVRFQDQSSSREFASRLASLKALIHNWPPAERPISWHQCQELSPNQVGKWERRKWSKWLDRDRDFTAE